MNKIKQLVDDYENYNSRKSPNWSLYLTIPFTTVHEYMKDLELISKAIAAKKVSSITLSAA